MRCTVLIGTADALSIQLTRTLNVSLHISYDWLDCFSGLSNVVTKPSEWNNINRDSSIFPELAQIYGLPSPLVSNKHLLLKRQG